MTPVWNLKTMSDWAKFFSLSLFCKMTEFNRSEKIKFKKIDLFHSTLMHKFTVCDNGILKYHQKHKHHGQASATKRYLSESNNPINFWLKLLIFNEISNILRRLDSKIISEPCLITLKSIRNFQKRFFFSFGLPT